MSAACDRVAIFGVGLIGGSLGLALRESGWCREVVGSTPHPAELERARARGLIDRGEPDPARAVAGADVVVAAVPLRAMRPVFAAIAPALGGDTVVTDVGSAKAAVVGDARATLGDAMARFVPGHPVAGTERGGVEAALAGLFAGRRVVLTPLAETDPGALGRVCALWAAVGAEVEQLDVTRHDAVLGATSHLPHVLAYALVDCLADDPEAEEVFRLAAGGLRDFTRIAASDAAMWRDILLANREQVLAAMTRYDHTLAAVRAAVEAGDAARLLELLERARAARLEHIEDVEGR